ncbi:MAG: helix-turn-helix domain-containing protein [Oscillospiraceae bacterium]
MSKGVAKKRYTGEIKQMVVEDMINNKLSYRDVRRKYGITAHDIPQKWERIYLEEGAEGLYIERRGRACSGNGTQKGRKPKLEKSKEEDLIAELQRLRIENEYLKKLNALVQSERQLPNKKHW